MVVEVTKSPAYSPEQPALWRALYANRYLRWTRRKAAKLVSPLFPKTARWVKVRGGLLEGQYILAELRHGEKAYWLGVFEPEIQRALETLGSRSPALKCVYDIGAHIGFHSIALTRCFPHARVIAFEPNPRNYTRLELNIGRNLLAGRIKCAPWAVSDESATTPFFLGESTWSGGLVRQHRDNYNTSLTVVTKTLDDIVFREGYPPPELIKIDAEGAETRVIRGGMRLLREYRPRIIAELHNPETAREVLSTLHDMSYEVEPLGDAEAEPMNGSARTGHFLATSRALG